MTGRRTHTQGGSRPGAPQAGGRATSKQQAASPAAAVSGPAPPSPAPPPPPSAPDLQARRQALRKKIMAAVIVAGVCIGVVTTRAIWEGTGALADGDAAASRGDYEMAVHLWRRAARWYVPGTPHVSEAYARLEDLAQKAQERGDLTTALAAWRGIRSSIHATRGLYTPFEERLEPANQQIATLMAAWEVGSEDAATGTRAAAPAAMDERARWHYQLLARDESPSVAWVLVAIVGFAMWLGGAVLFALRGVSPGDQLVPRTAAHAGILVATGLFVWVLGLYLA